LAVNGEIGSFGKCSVADTWYDPSTPGSGLVLSHARSSHEETVFGAWLNFDSLGAPQWHSLQGEQFAGSATLLGSVYRSTGANCGFLPTCASALRARPQTDIAICRRQRQ
jgi:hypothetical protein